jgi:peptidoglycan/LPS O-acetylase OafA/YrhL
MQLAPNPATASRLSSFRSDSSNLDIIRAVAVLSVFFAHLRDIVLGGPAIIGWHFAQMGVLIFFVHTSMVLMLSLERTKLEGKALFGAFYLRRFFRLYPLSMFCVTAAMLLHRAPDLANPVRYWKWSEYFSNMALTTNLTYTDIMVGGLWTLPLEVQMYLVLPFLFLLGCSRPGFVLALVWIASIPLALLQLNTSGRLSVLGYSPCFISGVIAWKLSLSVPRRLPGWLWPVGFVAVWPVFFLATHENDMYYRWAFCLALGLAIPWFKEIGFRPLQVAAHFIAKYSYGIYLFHIAVIMWSFSLPVPAAMKWVIFVISAAITPIAMYHVIEHSLILAGQRFVNRLFYVPLEQPISLAANRAVRAIVRAIDHPLRTSHDILGVLPSGVLCAPTAIPLLAASLSNARSLRSRIRRA